MQMQIRLYYFKTKLVKEANTLLCLSKDSNIIKCIMLPTISFISSKYYYTTISNNWLILDKHGMFKVLDEFDINI